MYVITKINKNKILNFNDIKFLIKYIQKHINNKKILNSILNILNKDIKLRKEKFGIDCIKELKKEKLLLPPKIQILLENQSKNKIDLITLKLTAILYNEYTRLTKEITERFIKGEIKYNKYEQKMKEYDIKFLKTSIIIK
jgi:hypothetical protein